MNITASYVAGFFDGEGTVGISHVKHPSADYYNVRVAIINTNRAILDAIQGTFGGSVGSHDKRRSDKHKQSWQVQWYSESAIEFLRTIYPYVIVKRDQIELALKFHDFRLSTLRPASERTIGIRRSDVEVIQMAEMRGQMLALNKRGPA